MKRFYAGFIYSSLAIAIAIAIVLVAGGQMMPANAAPPTVVPSPGYDARLQQSRTAQSYTEPAVRLPAPVAPVHRRHVKRAYGGVY
jgi:hypothetical protein